MIVLHGIIQFKDNGHTFVDVVVKTGNTGRNIRHRVGVDIEADRGKIITFLSNFYGVQHDEIVWPAHIELETGGR